MLNMIKYFTFRIVLSSSVCFDLCLFLLTWTCFVTEFSALTFTKPLVYKWSCQWHDSSRAVRSYHNHSSLNQHYKRGYNSVDPSADTCHFIFHRFLRVRVRVRIVYFMKNTSRRVFFFFFLAVTPNSLCLINMGSSKALHIEAFKAVIDYPPRSSKSFLFTLSHCRVMRRKLF